MEVLLQSNLKTKILVIIILLISNCSWAQVSGTIEVSFNKSVQLILPKNSSEVILDDDFGTIEDVAAQVTPDHKKMKLKALVYRFEETNVLIETTQGHYNFLLKYNENPDKFLYNINDYDPVIAKVQEIEEKSDDQDQKNSLPQSMSSQTSLSQNRKHLIDDMADEASYGIICEAAIEKDRKIYSIGSIDKKSMIYMENIYVYDNKLFFIVSIENQSNIVLDIDFSRVFIDDKPSFLRKSTSSPEDLIALYVHNKEEKSIPKGHKQTYVFVYDKFTIDKDKEVKIEFWEKGGERNLPIKVSSKDIIDTPHLDLE